MPVIPALRRLRQEDRKFEAILGKSLSFKNTQESMMLSIPKLIT
jgi:hypothetical protein